LAAFPWRPALSLSFGSDIAERAKNAAVAISFLAYWRICLTLTLASLAFGTWWLA
jgi:hypothetical protein